MASVIAAPAFIFFSLGWNYDEFSALFGQYSFGIFAGVVIGSILFCASLVPRLARLQPLSPNENVLFPIEIDSKGVTEEDDIEKQWADEDAATDEAMHASREAWICGKCKEKNEANFLDCWNCGRPHEGDVEQKQE